MAEPSYDTLRFERRGEVGWLRLHRPDKLNAITPTMWRELGDSAPGSVRTRTYAPSS